MFFESRQTKAAKRARKQALDLLEAARETGEDALATVSQTVGRAAGRTADVVSHRASDAADVLSSRAAQAAEYLGVRKPEPVRSSGEDALAFINGLVLGAVICAAIAFLLAPTDGATLRRRLKAQLDALLGRTSIEDTERAAAEAPGGMITPVAGTATMTDLGAMREAAPAGA